MLPQRPFRICEIFSQVFCERNERFQSIHPLPNPPPFRGRGQYTIGTDSLLIIRYKIYTILWNRKGSFMSTQKKKKLKISGQEFDKKFEAGGAIEEFLDFDKAVVVRRVNVDFPSWMIQMLDHEAIKLNVSRQAIIKLWINERLKEIKKVA